MSNYWTNLLIATSQAVNTVLGGYPDEMLSSRAYREQWYVLQFFIDWFFSFFGQEDHCRKCYEREKQRIDSPRFH